MSRNISIKVTANMDREFNSEVQERIGLYSTLSICDQITTQHLLHAGTAACRSVCSLERMDEEIQTMVHLFTFQHHSPCRFFRQFLFIHRCQRILMQHQLPFNLANSLTVRFRWPLAYRCRMNAIKQLSLATRISYLKETSWNPEKLLRGKNGIAALMFYDVSVLSDARR